MDRQLILREILDSLGTCCESFRKQSGGLLCEGNTVYKGEKANQEVRYHFIKIYYHRYNLLFKYTAHGFLSLTNSFLECLVALEKSEDARYYPLSSLLNYLDIGTLVPLTIPFITNGAVMAECFALLAGVVSAHQGQIEQLAAEPERKAQYAQAFAAEMESILHMKPAEEDESNEKESWLYEHYCDWLTNRCADEPYLLFMTGKYQQAIKKFRKYKDRSGYEDRLIILMEAETAPQPCIPTVIFENMTRYNPYGTPKNTWKELGALFASAFFWMLLWGIFFTGLFFLLYAIEARHALYLMGPLTMAPMLFLPSFLMGLATSYFSRKKAFKIFFRKDFKRHLEMDQITNGAGADKCMKIFFAILFVCGIIFTALTVKDNIKFEADGFIDSTGFFTVRGTYYPYSEIKTICYKRDRINGFGRTMDYPSYVLVLTSDREIDFYEYEETSNTEKELLPLLAKKGIKIESRKD